MKFVLILQIKCVLNQVVAEFFRISFGACPKDRSKFFSNCQLVYWSCKLFLKKKFELPFAYSFFHSQLINGFHIFFQVSGSASSDPNDVGQPIQ